jgi:hypothetical protein
VPIDETPPCEASVPEVTKTPQRSVSPVASGMISSIQLKKDEEDEKSRKRRRSSSVEGSGIGQPPSPTLPPPKVKKIMYFSLQNFTIFNTYTSITVLFLWVL